MYKFWFNSLSKSMKEVSREIQQWVSAHSGGFVWGCISTSGAGDCVNIDGSMTSTIRFWATMQCHLKTIKSSAHSCTIVEVCVLLCACIFFSLQHCISQAVTWFCVKCAAEIQIKVSLSIRCCVAKGTTFRFWIVATATNCLYMCWFCCR